MTFIEQDNKAEQAQYRQDMMANVLGRATSNKLQAEDLTRKRFPEEN